MTRRPPIRRIRTWREAQNCPNRDFQPWTLSLIIMALGLNPRVIRDDGQDRGDDWHTTYAGGELEEPVTDQGRTNGTDWWRAGGVLLTDDYHQSIIRNILPGKRWRPL
jgi:hypothetical protein